MVKIFHTTRRNVVGSLLYGTLGSVLASPYIAAEAKGSPKKPNIVFIMADDLGYADLSCFGGTYKTPNIDRIGRDGITLDQAYANSAVCSPTRAALITGRYAQRLPVGLDEPLGNAQNVGLPPEHPTLPSLLKLLGYRTVLVGKWHLGDPPNFGPRRSGYDEFLGILHGGSDYFYHPPVSPAERMGGLIHDEQPIEYVGYITNVLGDKAVEEIRRNAAAHTPFFLSLHFTAPHWPWESPDDEASSKSIKGTMHLDGGNIATYARMISSLDENVAKVLSVLHETGIDKNTIVIFTSDNGGERFSNTWPLVGMKSELLEGGIRVPVLMRWPGRIASRSRSKQVMASMDWLPTLLAMAGGAPAPDYPSDGINLLPVLLGSAPVQPRTIFWRYKANAQAAVRDDNWKYLKLGDKEFLFDIATDERERANLKAKFPDIFERLKSAHAAWDSQMLPYGPNNTSWDAKIGYSDRY